MINISNHVRYLVCHYEGLVIHEFTMMMIFHQPHKLVVIEKPDGGIHK